MERVVNAKMHIVLEGFPERVQETADVLDRAFPGLMTWQRFAEPGRDQTVRLEGEASERNALLRPALHLANQTVRSNKPWKLSPAASCVLRQRGVFCASLSKSFQP